MAERVKREQAAFKEITPTVKPVSRGHTPICKRLEPALMACFWLERWPRWPDFYCLGERDKREASIWSQCIKASTDGCDKIFICRRHSIALHSTQLKHWHTDNYAVVSPWIIKRCTKISTWQFCVVLAGSVNINVGTKKSKKGLHGERRPVAIGMHGNQYILKISQIV